MLADFFKSDQWQPVMTGVQMLKLASDTLPSGFFDITPRKQSARRLEIFFCCSGSVLVARRKSPPLHLQEQDIFLFTDASDIKSLQITDPPAGYCVSVDFPLSRDGFSRLCGLLGNLDLHNGRVTALMERYRGCLCIHSTPWNRSAFQVLSGLPAAEQAKYCMMKSVELVYLLCAQDALLERASELSPALGYSVHTISRVRTYMEEHLDEKLTIAVMSRMFHLSPTSLKTGFRSLYGQPIHSWLQEKRIQRSAELLSFSRMTVLQIAQAVGYEGVSQFNVVFKRRFGVTPSQYRKMSDSVTI